MNSEQANKISVIDPISPAIERVKLLLFKPFNLGKWFTIGFCAWLAYLGGSGGGGGGPRYNFGPNGQTSKITEGIGSAKEYVISNLFWIIPVAAAVALFVIGISLVILWLNSRGRFMFLHCIAENKSEVKIPWQKFKKQGNSLFLFRIVLGIIGLAAIAAPVIGIILLVIAMTDGAALKVAGICGIGSLGLIIFVFLIMLSLVKKFTFDFVVPIMFLRTADCTTGWREFMTILSVNKARLALYILFQIVISIAIGAIIMLGFCIGCCLCCISLLLFVPYIGTVILLPLLVFKRAYSLYYLRQFGTAFDVFRL